MQTRAPSAVSRRTLLKAGLTTAVVGPVAACSPGSTVSGSGSGSGAKTISVLVLGPSAETLTLLRDTLIPSFTKQSSIEVTIQQSDWGSGFQKVTTAAASGTLADVTMLGGIWVAPIASKNALLPLDDMLADWSDKANFYPALLDDCTYQGKTYGLPLYSDTRTALYRSDFLNKVGASTDDLPTTWAEYRALAVELSKATGGPTTAATDWFQDKAIGLQQSFAQLLFQAGGTYYGEDGRAQFSSDAGVTALDYLMGFYRDKLSDANLVYQGTGPKPIVSGQAGTIYSGFLEVANARQNAPQVASKLTAGKPLTATKGGKPATCAWVNKLGVSARSKNPDAAVEFVKFLVGKEAAPQLGALYGGLPARTDLTGADYLKDLSKAYIDAANYVVPQPPNPNMLTIAPEINTAIQKAVRLQGTAQEILADLDKRIDQINGKA